MQIKLVRYKIDRAAVPDVNTHYAGRLGIDVSFMNRLSLRPYENNLCGNINNGNLR